jgi:hypothetical protein
MTERGLLERLWAAVGGERARVAGLELRGEMGLPPSPLPAGELLTGAVGAALLAAAELAEARGAGAPRVGLDRAHVAVAAASERHVRLDGAVAGAAFDPTSAFFRARDGWVRTHGNYPHHRAALLRALGAPHAGDLPDAIAAAGAHEVEDRVVAAGGCAAAVRTPTAWAAHPQGRALAGLPLVARSRGPECAGLPPLGPGALPGAGLRVLDLTRVIAGPVGTRMLAALGADVVRVEPPASPELPLLALDGGVGKRLARVDLRTPDGAAWLAEQLERADLVVDGYRPGALAPFGLTPDALAERHPHVGYVSLSAWGETGPWGARRGFDSLVQAASGIAHAVRPGDEHGPPGALPVQALDHATGYLLAAAALRALAERATTGRSRRARLALAATARLLLDAAPPPEREPGREADPAPYLRRVAGPAGTLTVVAPPGDLDGRPLTWPAYS